MFPDDMLSFADKNKSKLIEKKNGMHYSST
jgi:hypothetical protein